MSKWRITMVYPQIFQIAINKLMEYEVGGFWDINAPGAQDGTIPRACGYVNNPADPGGETKYGIAKNDNPSIDISSLNFNSAMAIYWNKYWLTTHCDQLPNRIAVLTFDGSVNNGPRTAAKFLQQAIGVTADGSIGQQTITAVNLGDPINICNLICDQREKYYQNIVSNNPAESIYLNGWLRRINEMRAFTADLNGNF